MEEQVVARREVGAAGKNEQVAGVKSEGGSGQVRWQ